MKLMQDKRYRLRSICHLQASKVKTAETLDIPLLCQSSAGLTLAQEFWRI